MVLGARLVAHLVSPSPLNSLLLVPHDQLVPVLLCGPGGVFADLAVEQLLDGQLQLELLPAEEPLVVSVEAVLLHVLVAGLVLLLPGGAQHPVGGSLEQVEGWLFSQDWANLSPSPAHSSCLEEGRFSSLLQVEIQI